MMKGPRDFWYPRKFRKAYRSSFRREPTAEEQAIISKAEQLRQLVRRHDKLREQFREAVTRNQLAQAAGWPYNPDRLQQVLQLAAECMDLWDRAKKLNVIDDQAFRHNQRRATAR